MPNSTLDRIEYEKITIKAEEPILKTPYRYVQSPWITINDGITGEYYQHNSVTGERREVPFEWWNCGLLTKP